MRTILVTLAGVSMLVALAGCDGKPQDRANVGDVGNGIEPVVESSPDAQAVMEKQCTRCHGLDRAETHHFDRAGWEKIIGEMIGKGATLTADERTAVIDFLAKRDAGTTTAPHHDHED